VWMHSRGGRRVISFPAVCGAMRNRGSGS
jgi:hypothetical protein